MNSRTERRGRPKLTEEQRRIHCLDRRVNVPVSDELYERLERVVEPPDTFAAYVRRLLERELNSSAA